MNGVVILYSLEDEESFRNAAHWLEDVRRYSNDPEIMIAGTHYEPSASPAIAIESALVPLTSKLPFH